MFALLVSVDALFQVCLHYLITAELILVGVRVVPVGHVCFESHEDVMVVKGS